MYSGMFLHAREHFQRMGERGGGRSGKGCPVGGEFSGLPWAGQGVGGWVGSRGFSALPGGGLGGSVFAHRHTTGPGSWTTVFGQQNGKT